MNKFLLLSVSKKLVRGKTFTSFFDIDIDIYDVGMWHNLIPDDGPVQGLKYVALVINTPLPLLLLLLLLLLFHLQHAPLHGNTTCTSIHIVFACYFGQLLTLSLRVLYFYVLVFI